MPVPYKKSKEKSSIPCIYFKRGTCSNQRCPYLHVRQGEKSATVATRGPPDAGTNLLTTMLRLVFEKQQQRVYNAKVGLLDLSDFKSIPDLADVVNSINFNTQNFCSALCSTIKSLIVPPPSAIQLKGNNITSVSCLAAQLESADLHLSLRAISLESNQIKTLEAIQELKKFSNLQEIVLRGNPVCERGDYRPGVKKLLPFLLGLDGESIMVPPLSLPWPLFTPVGYTDAQQHVLQFVQCALLNPLEADSSSGTPCGVDATSDLYAVNAVLTISLSSPEAAVSTPMRSAESNLAATQKRNAIREVVSLRLKQTESNHNLLHGVKSTVVACGRTKVCAQMEHWLYPKCFKVSHHLHSAASVTFLDNTYQTCPTSAVMKVPVTVVTIHGVMSWTNTTAQGHSASDPMVIRRNFSRVLTVLQNEAGRWLITNDMVSLYPAPSEAGGNHPSSGDNERGNTTSPSALNECRILYNPRVDFSRANMLSRKKNVPTEVILALCQHVNSDAELITVLDDLSGVPLSMFEHCAALAGNNVLESIQVCRIGNLFRVGPEDGLALLRQLNGNWLDVVKTLSSTAARGDAAA
ncbi:hypothetical protein ERJ75_000323900 [Trypanosoma vivax]|uniref:C3H1-type domain-containing protein n=1 Tax=Trypanosoma vivax (strain Y486) TaxID=1055687 RepID=G0UAB8_TRYVY|nr:hypothetical protein TRVL_04901 [Trypanosoma vivax]KAH8618008.1 hypothetical protein ERJ75_000323900 [Trypanosoma vivax]CCC52751.1 conserved hypothetical protein [Trypanosoma vivax Y486]